MACFDDKLSSQPTKMIVDNARPAHSASLDFIPFSATPKPRNRSDLIRREQVKPQLLLSTGSSTRRLGRNRVPIWPLFLTFSLGTDELSRSKNLTGRNRPGQWYCPSRQCPTHDIEYHRPRRLPCSRAKFARRGRYTLLARVATSQTLPYTNTIFRLCRTLASESLDTCVLLYQ